MVYEQRIAGVQRLRFGGLNHERGCGGDTGGTVGAKRAVGPRPQLFARSERAGSLGPCESGSVF